MIPGFGNIDTVGESKGSSERSGTAKTSRAGMRAARSVR